MASTLKSQAGKGGSGIGPEYTFVAETLREHPRPGSNSNGAMVANTVVAKWANGTGHAPDEMPYIAGAGVRRLTPVECERLQAWPDQWTNPDGTAPDSRRYAACGDGVTSSVAEWIGRRLIQAGAEASAPLTKGAEQSAAKTP